MDNEINLSIEDIVRVLGQKELELIIARAEIARLQSMQGAHVPDKRPIDVNKE